MNLRPEQKRADYWRRMKWLHKPASWVLILSLLFLTACSGQQSVHLLDQMDDYGMKQAIAIAGNQPQRIAGSQAEKAAADYIDQEFRKMGYVTESQTVTLEDGVSRNIIVRIPGTGFMASEELAAELNYDIFARRAKAKEGVFRREVVVGARYDSNPGNTEGADGISDNASGVAALLTLARELKKEPVGYDLVLVALGAGYHDIMGARTFVNALSEEERQRIDCFYEFRSLYGGSKLYASAGWSSLYKDRKYQLRQPLYEVADIALRENVYQKSGVALYQNQSIYTIANPLNGETVPEGFQKGPEKVVFHEISRASSDYRAFDRKGIACVFFESYDYSADRYEALKENADPNFAGTEYTVRGTAFDNRETLGKVLTEELLKDRINVSAYLVFEAINSGVLGGAAFR